VTAKDGPLSGYSCSESTTYRKEIERLNGKWPHAESDLSSALKEMPLDIVPGVAIPNLKEHAGKVFKRQILSTDIKDGKSGGFRLIYLVADDRKSVTFLSIYCKSEKVDIPGKILLRLIKMAEEFVPPGTVSVSTTPPNAEVWIDSSFMDWSPCTFSVAPGDHVILCRIQPDLIAERTFTSRSGVVEVIEIHLK
jgi:mRNA-degrading endonuclease RelE of RelBE toxin-antitoxin system